MLVVLWCREGRQGRTDRELRVLLRLRGRRAEKAPPARAHVGRDAPFPPGAGALEGGESFPGKGGERQQCQVERATFLYKSSPTLNLRSRICRRVRSFFTLVTPQSTHGEYAIASWRSSPLILFILFVSSPRSIPFTNDCLCSPPFTNYCRSIPFTTDCRSVPLINDC